MAQGINQPGLNDLEDQQFGTALKVTAGGPSTNQTIKSFTGKQALSTGSTTTVTLETVTTGKTFYITDIFLSTDVVAATQILDVQLQGAGVTILRTAIHSLSAFEVPGIESQPSANSAQLVTILLPQLASGTGNFYYFVSGFEQ